MESLNAGERTKEILQAFKESADYVMLNYLFNSKFNITEFLLNSLLIVTFVGFKISHFIVKYKDSQSNLN